jgi:hypothetical protein
MVALLAACIILPAFGILAVAMLAKSWCQRKGSATARVSKHARAAADGCSSSAAGAAAAAKVVGSGGCGKVTVSSSGEMQLQLPAALLQSGSADSSSDMSSNADDVALAVKNGRPPLQQLIEGWMAMLQQLPQKDAAAAVSSSSSSSNNRKSQGGVRCTVYAMGPAALVADAQVLCGGMKGVHFVQKAFQL